MKRLFIALYIGVASLYSVIYRYIRSSSKSLDIKTNSFRTDFVYCKLFMYLITHRGQLGLIRKIFMNSL